MIQELQQYSTEEQSQIQQVWGLFSAARPQLRRLMLGGMLYHSCLPQLSFLSQELDPLLRIDFLASLPTEISFKILRHLDAQSLCRAAQVSTIWRRLADDDAVWRRICEQHIDRKCTKCGWGLPLLDRSKRRRCKEDRVVQEQAERLRGGMRTRCQEMLRDHDGLPIDRGAYATTAEDEQPCKRPRLATPVAGTNDGGTSPATSCTSAMARPMWRRPWKEVYAERAIIERNWRCGQYTSRVLRGHTDGVMCLQFDDTYLCTGGYDATVRVWCVKTGRCLRLLKGHTRCVRALTFDDVKLVTASMDRTIRVWNYRTGECMRTLEGHTDGVVCISANRTLLVSGSADATVKVWNFEQGSSHTLRGHTDWVNAVQLYRGRWVFSGSDDTTVRLWDLTTFTCVRIFRGHVGQVQSVSIMPSGNGMSDEEFLAWLALDDDSRPASTSPASATSTHAAIVKASSPGSVAGVARPASHAHVPQLLTGALDNTLRVFNLRTGECQQTFFGHVEGVWCLAVDSLRVVSGAHDKTLRIWDPNTGACMHALEGHRGAVTCVGLSDTRVITGSDDCEIRIWDFSPQEAVQSAANGFIIDDMNNIT
ncbi:WD40-repeat-containing domain protein [Syncephalis pseudoplumigaleata]|uniref:WD40-repeat-containing domain protein n=1 Tax=Syncephalis pseudoplumigaleata TaxID=1712513 RepID=A0A4P9YXF8_9FUNG|nr:WD40-repeat-containing domain protein [Syncephalis pseudoplumigaleata]|eukprot:RKP24737.1 WD40-repeat-containing domain protein [Syncephalis pseudoplumigaleata]